MADGMWHQIEGNWKQLTGEAKRQWGKLTDDEIAETHGNRDKLMGLIQERYGIAREDVELQMDKWAEGLNRNLNQVNRDVNRGTDR